MRGLPSQVKDDRKRRSLNAQGLGPCPVGVRGFESHPPHFGMNPPPASGIHLRFSKIRRDSKIVLYTFGL